MIRFSMRAVPGVTHRRGVYLRRWAVAGVAACAMAAGALAGGGVAGSGHRDGGASAAAGLADSSSPAIGGGVRVGSASATSLFGGLAGGQSCFEYPASCYAPRPFRTGYGIPALLDRGIDGRGQTVVVPKPRTRRRRPRPVSATSARTWRGLTA